MLTKKQLAALLAASAAGAIVALALRDAPPPGTPADQRPAHAGEVAPVPGRLPASEVIRLSTRTGPQLDPLRDDYDPLAAVLDGSDGADLYRLEPRRAAWAEPVEARLRRQLDRDFQILFPEASLEHVECRTSTCELAVIVPEGQADDIYEHVLLSPVGSSLSRQRIVRPDGRTELSIVAVIARDIRDDYLAWQADERRSVLDRMDELSAHAPDVIAQLRASSE